MDELAFELELGLGLASRVGNHMVDIHGWEFMTAFGV